LLLDRNCVITSCAYTQAGKIEKKTQLKTSVTKNIRVNDKGIMFNMSMQECK